MTGNDTRTDTRARPSRDRGHLVERRPRLVGGLDRQQRLDRVLDRRALDPVARQQRPVGQRSPRQFAHL